MLIDLPLQVLFELAGMELVEGLQGLAGLFVEGDLEGWHLVLADWAV